MSETVANGANFTTNKPTDANSAVFTDPPLSDIQVNFRDGGSGETSATSITYDDTTGTKTTTPATGVDHVADGFGRKGSENRYLHDRHRPVSHSRATGLIAGPGHEPRGPRLPAGGLSVPSPFGGLGSEVSINAWGEPEPAEARNGLVGRSSHVMRGASTQDSGHEPQQDVLGPFVGSDSRPEKGGRPFAGLVLIVFVGIETENPLGAEMPDDEARGTAPDVIVGDADQVRELLS